MADLVDAFRRQLAEQVRFGFRHEQRRIVIARHAPLVRQQLLRFVAVQPIHRPRFLCGVLAPFIRIDVAEIDHAAHAGIRIGVLRHGRREYQHARNFMLRDGLVDPGFGRCIAVVIERQRAVAEQCTQAAHARNQWIELGKVAAGAQRFDARHVLPVVRIVDEGGQVHPVRQRQMFQEVVRADLVALVRRIRNPVDQQQQVFHAVQPRLRTMYGPIKLATGSGSLRHILMNSAYFGLSGLLSGRDCDAYSLYSYGSGCATKPQFFLKS